MTTAPIFSVILPCYNAQATLRATIASVLSQTLSAWELIIVDDGSDDASLDIIESFASQDDRIRLERQVHQGVSCARNAGIPAAKGRYLAFLDADDLWHPEKLALHFEHFVKCSRVGVSFARVRFMSPNGEPLAQVSAVPKQGLSAFSLLTENHISTSSNIVARRELFDALGGFQTDMSFAEDQEWLCRVALDGRWTLEGISQTLVYYRTSPGSLSSSLERMEAGWRIMLDSIRNHAPAFLSQHQASAEAIYLRYLARRALRQGNDPRIGLNYLKRAWHASAAALLRQPRRSLLTLLGLLAWKAWPTLTNRYFLHLQPR